MIVSREYSTVVGTNRMFHPSIHGARILGVKREGIGLTSVAFVSSPVNREFSYGFSSIYVDASNPFGANEKVWVLYEI